MSIHQLTPRKNIAVRAERVVRAAGCAAIRQAWELVLLETPPMAEAVRTAERFVEGSATDKELTDARLAVTPSVEDDSSPYDFVDTGDAYQTMRSAVRCACRAACAESEGEALHAVIFWISLAMAARDLDGSAGQRLLARVARFQHRTTRWTSLAEILLTEAHTTLEMCRRGYAAMLTQAAHARLQKEDLSVDDGRRPAVLPASDSMVLFGWGLPLTSRAGSPALDDPDGLLARVVRHPRLDVLWRECARNDWRAWLEAVARAHGVITHARHGNPFDPRGLDRRRLSERRDEVWYALDPRATRLEVSAIRCMPGTRPDEAIH